MERKLFVITNRIDGIARIPKEYLVESLPSPKSIKIELVPRCNYKCKYCGLSKRNHQPTMDMDFDLFVNIAQQAKENNIDEVGLFYIGEPLVNPNLIIRACNYLKKELNIPYVFLTTNGSLAFKNILEELMAAGLDSLKWSYNYFSSEDLHQKTEAPKIFWDKTNKNIKDAFDVRKNFGFKTRLYASSIMFSENYNVNMKQALDKFVFPYVDEHYWLPLLNHGYVIKGETSQGNTARYHCPVDPLPCWSIFTIAHVLSDGRLTACCFDAYGDWVVGDLKNGNFMEEWNSEKFKKLRRLHLIKNVTGSACEKCVLIKDKKI
jgi:MoaA/NifB/PqqE/SkfB family radical SAM enzyme